MPYNESIVYKRIYTIPAINKDQDRDLLFLNLEYIGQYKALAINRSEEHTSELQSPA